MGIAYNMGKGKYKNWIVAETEFIPEYSGKWETIFSLGNGYMGVRAATEEGYIEEHRGYYIAGVYDEFPGEVTEIVNIPDWINFEITLDGERFDLKRGSILFYQRRLNLKDGLLVREVKWESPAGKITELTFERFVSVSNIHSAAQKITVKPLNYSGTVELLSGINGQVTNSGVQHLKEDKLRLISGSIILMGEETQQSHVHIAIAMVHEYFLDNKRIASREKVITGRRRITLKTVFTIGEKQILRCEKLISIYTSRDPDLAGIDRKPEEIAEHYAVENLKTVKETGYGFLLKKHTAKWHALWEKADILIGGADFDQLAVRFSIFHILQMTPFHDNRLSIAAKGLSGEGYKGHVFWDTEIFLIPFFIYTFPDTAKNLLIYRYRSLDGARMKARDNGFKGAMYPWESADTGVEVTPKWGAVDIETGKSIRIWSGELEQHITADVVYSIWNYFLSTNDYDFMYDYGLEIMLETARFWNSRLEYNREEKRYEINRIMGPDEYSEHVNNNAFTNYMVKLQLNRTVLFSEWVQEHTPEVWSGVSYKIRFADSELEEWKSKVDRIFINIDRETGFIHQYEAFTEKKTIDLSKYRGKVGAILEEYSWKDVMDMQVIKQADVVMLLCLAGDEFSRNIKKINWNFYEPKTLHDSSLSSSVHAITAVDIGDMEKAYHYFSESLRIDLGENLNSSSEGLHAASHGGNWQAVVKGFGGTRLGADGELKIEPHLPEKWESLEFNLFWHGNRCNIHIKRNIIILKTLSSIKEPFKVQICGKEYLMENSKELQINYK